MKKGVCTIGLAKTKVLISCAVTAQLICAFVFSYACCWFSHVAAQMISKNRLTVSKKSFVMVSSPAVVNPTGDPVSLERNKFS